MFNCIYIYGYDYIIYYIPWLVYNIISYTKREQVQFIKSPKQKKYIFESTRCHERIVYKNSLIRKVRIIFFQYFIITHRADTIDFLFLSFALRSLWLSLVDCTYVLHKVFLPASIISYLLFFTKRIVVNLIIIIFKGLCDLDIIAIFFI